MRNAIALLISICAFSSAQAAQTISVSGTLDNTSSGDAVVAVYAEYVATRDLPTCKDYSLEDLKPHSSPKVKQQLVLMEGDRFHADVASEFGVCKYQLRSAGIAVVNPNIVNNILKMGGQMVDDNIIEFTGGISNLVRVKGGKQSLMNTLKCSWDTTLSTKCDAKEVISNGSSIDLTVKIQP